MRSSLPTITNTVIPGSGSIRPLPCTSAPPGTSRPCARPPSTRPTPPTPSASPAAHSHQHYHNECGSTNRDLLRHKPSQLDLTTTGGHQDGERICSRSSSG